MDEAFFKASAPQRFTCLGLPLKTLTLGHLFTLEQFGSELIDRYGNPKFSDLLVSSLICSLAPGEFERLLGTKRLRVFLWAWARFAKRLNAAVELARFKAYLNCSLACPEYRPAKNTVSRAAGTPNAWRMLAMLMTDFGLSEKEAMAMPVVRINCLWAAQEERAGKIEAVWNAHRSAFLKAAEEAESQERMRA